MLAILAVQVIHITHLRNHFSAVSRMPPNSLVHISRLTALQLDSFNITFQFSLAGFSESDVFLNNQINYHLHKQTRMNYRW